MNTGLEKGGNYGVNLLSGQALGLICRVIPAILADSAPKSREWAAPIYKAALWRA